MNAVVNTGRASSPRYLVHWFDGTTWACTPFALPLGAAEAYARALRFAHAYSLEQVG